jgi:hypothetical protein
MARFLHCKSSKPTGIECGYKRPPWPVDIEEECMEALTGNIFRDV